MGVFRISPTGTKRPNQYRAAVGVTLNFSERCSTMMVGHGMSPFPSLVVGLILLIVASTTYSVSLLLKMPQVFLQETLIEILSAESNEPSTNITARPQEDERIEVQEMEMYWNLSCPFESSKLSQSYMATTHHNSSEDKEIYGIERAILARDYAMDAHALERVHTALVSGAFNDRRIAFDGDSLTRQLFMSLGCLAWSSGHVVNHNISWIEYSPEDTAKFSKMFHKFINKGPHSVILNARIELDSGAELIYDDRYNGQHGRYMYHRNNPIRKLLNWTASCQADLPIYQGSTLLDSKDFVVINAGQHPDRNKQFAEIKNLLSCIKTKRRLYPHFTYMLTPLQHFWTAKGGPSPRGGTGGPAGRRGGLGPF